MTTIDVEAVRVDFEGASRRTERADPQRSRHSLGAQSLRLTTSMAPEAYAVVRDVAATLGIDEPVELYRSEGRHLYDNAYNVDLGDAVGIHFVGRWLDELPPPCLAVVLGHELGHWLAKHAHASRHEHHACELTADRFAVIAAGLDAGLRMTMISVVGVDARITFDTAAYLAECRTIVETGLASGFESLGDAHPEHRVRAVAKWLFSESDVHRALTGRGSGRLDLREVDRNLREIVERLPTKPAPWMAPIPGTEVATPPRIVIPQPTSSKTLEALAVDILADSAVRKAREVAGRVAAFVNGDAPEEPERHEDTIDPLEEDRRELEERFRALEDQAFKRTD